MRTLTIIVVTAGMALCAALWAADPAPVPAAKPAESQSASADGGLKVQYQIPNIAGTPNNLVGLKSDGTLVFDGKDGTAPEIGVTAENKDQVAAWKDIVQVAPGWHHLVVLKKDGTVVGVAGKGFEKSVAGISEWKDIVALDSGYAQTLGLKKDGTVLATLKATDIAAWKEIIGVAAGGHSAGLKKDGTVVASGNNWRGALNVSEWKDIVEIAAGDDQTYGLKKDGTVVVAGYTNLMEKWKFNIDTSKMTDVVDIKTRSWGIIGLRKDGTVVTAGEDNWKQQAMNEAGVKDVVAVTSCEHCFVVLKQDGTIFAVGESAKARNAMGWNLGATAPDAWQVRKRVLTPIAGQAPVTTAPTSRPAEVN